MSEPDDVRRPSGSQEARRRRVAEVFGDVLPDTTSDERDPETGGAAPTSDDWYREQVPPHHG